MVESGRLPAKGRFRAGIEKLSFRVPQKGRISVSTEKLKNPGEYREKVESVRVSKSVQTCIGKGPNQCEYRKMDESGRRPEIGRIPVSIENLSQRITEKGRLSVSTEK